MASTTTSKHFRPNFTFSVLTSFLLLLTACQPLHISIPVQGLPTPNITHATQSAKSNRTPTPTQEPISQLGVNPDDLHGITLSFWHPWSRETAVTLNLLVNEFNETNDWGIQIDSANQGGYDEVNEKIQLALNKGNLPHLVVGYSYQTLTWVEIRNIFLDLNPYVDDPFWGLTEDEQKDFFPAYWDSGEIEGVRLGIPAQSSGQVLFYNTTWAKELGYKSPPDTPDQFQKQACAAFQANQQDDDLENDKTGGYIISTNYATNLGWIYAFGAEILVPDGKGYEFDKPEIKATYNFLRGLYDDGCAWLSENEGTVDEFASRKGLFAAGSIADIPLQAKAFTMAGNADEWTVIPFPSSETKPVILVYGPAFNLLQSTPEEQLASWLFVKWLVSPENHLRFVQATQTLPVQVSVLEELNKKSAESPQWTAALELLPLARHEPSIQSWMTVRWAVSDASKQLFQWYFEASQIPTLTKLLDKTAADLNIKTK